MISDIRPVASLPQSPRSIVVMLVLLLIALQAQPVAPASPPERIDLMPLAGAPQRCGGGEEGEIVVCARTAGSDRLQRGPERYVEQPLQPEIGIAGGKAAVRAEQRSLPGATAPALMLDFRLPF